jgi:hypothetical protein
VSTSRCFAFVSIVLLELACGPASPASPASAAGARGREGATIACPAGAGQGAEQRLAAIRAVGALAQSIKDQRVELCQRYVRCKVPVAERDAQDRALAEAMRSLIDLWNKRRISGPDEVTRFREAVRAIDRRVNGGAASGPPASLPPRTLKADEALARVVDAGVAFRTQPGSVSVSATAGGKREALLGKREALALAAGHRYRIKVSGAYQPSSPPLVQPGDELVARLAYQAEGAGSVQVTLRSLEDPDGTEASESWAVAAGEKGTRAVKLTADPQQTGFYLGVTVKGAPVELEGIELLRGGKVLVAARAGDPSTKTECAPGKAPGGSLRCLPGDGDRVTVGEPDGYLVLGLRDAAGPRASTRALSLEGDRSVDARVGDAAELVITLVGAGSATLERVEITDLGL